MIITRSWRRPLYLLAAIYLLLSLFAIFFADRLIFPAPGSSYPEDRSHFSSLSEGKDRTAIYSRPASPGMPTLLWSHGNAQNLGHLKSTLDLLNGQGFGVIAYDYPGYGESHGKPSEKGCYRAITRTYQHITDTLKIDPQNIILIGHSVGSGPTSWLAAQEEVRGVILISPFLSTFRTVTHIPLFPGDRFPNHKHLPQIHCPLLIIHGELDQVVPFSQGEKLFRLSPSLHKTFLAFPHAGHNDLFLQGDFNLPEILREFLDLN